LALSYSPDAVFCRKLPLFVIYVFGSGGRTPRKAVSWQFWISLYVIENILVELASSQSSAIERYIGTEPAKLTASG
jgi:hypothetical protein